MSRTVSTELGNRRTLTVSRDIAHDWQAEVECLGTTLGLGA